MSNLPPGGEDNARRRLRPADTFNDANDDRPPTEQHPPTPNRRNRTSGVSRVKNRAAIAFLVIGLYYLSMGIFVHVRMNSYPEPKSTDNSYPYEFREESARSYLKAITDFGPRVSGSEANANAEKYILQVVENIAMKKISNNGIEVSVQTVSGDLTVDFIGAGLGEFTSVYQNLKNIVVKTSPPQQTNSSVLVNCHYDSVIDSPGAGDDAASCAVMLEILRALSQSSVTIMHNIIFLFNSAEENMLQTSHGFITQHPWASSIKAFLNLDSAGAGGWEIVFQTGPEHPWLIKAYIEAAPYPHASVVGQEVFQTGVIPSDTDFRIFRDYGNIPGIDIAHIKNGYVYHTRNDVPGYIPAGCMQRGGENVMATLILLASSSKLTNPKEDRHGSMVFFDYLGFFMVAYPKRIATILNWTTSLYVYVAFVKRMLRERASGAGCFLKQMLGFLLVSFLTWVLALLVPVAMGLFMTATGYSLSYYTHNMNVIWLFMLPSVTVIMAFHLFLKNVFFKGMDPSNIVLMLQETNLMLWSVVLVVMTIYDVMSAFMPLMFILCPAFMFTVLDVLGLKPTNLLFSLLASFIPSLYVVYISYTLFIFLIPIMGRTGLETSPDVLIAGLAGLPIMVCLPYQIGFVYTHSRVCGVITTTVAVTLLGLIAVIFTPAGFPYSYNPQDASIQRALLVHFDRRFHSYNGQVNTKDAYIWYKPLDYHGAKMLESYAPDVFAQARRATCDGVYCGRPYLYPILSQVDARKTYDFPASHLNLTRVAVEQSSRTLLGESQVRLAFNVSGPSHITVFVSGLPLVKVKRWSCDHHVPVEIFTLPFMHYPTHFIYYSNASPSNTTWLFSIDVEVENHKSINSSLIRMGFAGHYLHGPNQITQDILALEEELPLWMLTARWSATYDEYIF